MVKSQSDQIKILQCGYPKSGNYLLYKILKGILECKNQYKTFVGSSGIGTIISQFCQDFMTFPELTEVDNIRLKDENVFLEYPHPQLRLIPVDHAYLSKSTLLWTHERVSHFQNPVWKITHGFYIVRDGRDVITSDIYYTTSERYLKLRPENKIHSPDALFDNIDHFEKSVRDWVAHVNDYLISKKNFIPIRYEDLIDNKSLVIRNIVKFLNIEITDNQVRELVTKSSFNNMAKSAPNHLRKGTKNNWKFHFTNEHNSIFNSIAGDTMLLLGYNIDVCANPNSNS